MFKHTRTNTESKIQVDMIHLLAIDFSIPLLFGAMPGWYVTLEIIAIFFSLLVMIILAVVFILFIIGMPIKTNPQIGPIISIKGLTILISYMIVIVSLYVQELHPYFEMFTVATLFWMIVPRTILYFRRKAG